MARIFFISTLCFFNLSFLANALAMKTIEPALPENHPIVQAIDQDQIEILQKWLQSGHSPLVQIKNKLHERLIDRALTHASQKSFSLLLSELHRRKLDFKLSDSRGTPYLVTLAALAIPSNKKREHYEKMMDWVLKFSPGSAKEQDHAYVGDGRSALHQAAALGNLMVMQKLVKSGASVEVKSSNGETPLHLAARFGHLEAVKYLVSEGADLNAKSKFTQTTPLMASAEMGHENVIRYLVLSGAKRDARDAFGKTAPERFKEYALAYHTAMSKKASIR